MNIKKNQKNTLLGAIITTIIILMLIVCGDNSQIFKTLTSATNGNVNSETIENLKNVTIVTGNDCISKIPGDNSLRVYCFDVGQGDSILITNNNQTMLIDASTNEMGQRVVEYLNELGINRIDYLIGTHPHEDHIGGLDDVIKNFDIGTIYMPNVIANTRTYEDVLDAISQKNLKVTTPKIGDKFNIGYANCEIMSIGNNKDDYNNCSIVVEMEFNDVKYLFTGDAEEEVESSRNWPQVDILKVGHHGSNTSSSKAFLNQIHPKVALISVGKGNSYGHPTQNTLKRLNNIGAKIYRTDENETILLIEKGE